VPSNEVIDVPPKFVIGQPVRRASMGTVPLWGFVAALIVFAIVYFAAPEGVRPWLAAVIVLGALATQPGIVGQASTKLFGG
jgi:hypothetical protein